MNNREISRILRSDPIVCKTFNGVFPGNFLPTSAEKKKPGFYVANTDPDHKPGEHWVAFYVPETKDHYMEYWDSYGFNPPSIFLPFLDDTYKRSAKFIQHPLSATCGQYCIFYIWRRCYGNQLEDIASTFTKDQLLNDVIVNKFIEEKFCVDLDIFDESFINKQICKAFQICKV